MQARSLLAVALVLGGCGARQAGGTDEAAAGTGDAASTGESETSSTTTTTTGESESTTVNPESTSSSEESGPTPDIPDDLPDECVPVNFLDPDDRGGLPTEVWAGWVHCKDSFFRIEAIDCPIEAGYELCLDSEVCDGCDPTEQCLDWYGNSGYCFCGHNCTTDSDCGTNEICVCRSGILGSQLISRNTCLPADCTGQADCAAVPDESVPRCRLARDLCFSPSSVHCRTEADSCLYDGDCPSQWCSYDPGDELWTCDSPAICE